MVSVIAARHRHSGDVLAEKAGACDNVANLFSFFQKHPNFVPTATRSEESKTR
jgi:hypothetical protein